MTQREKGPAGPLPHSNSDSTGLETTGFSPVLSWAVGVYRQWLHLPDIVPLLTVWGAYAANHCDGDPTWLMHVGSPGSGKTEILTPLTSLDRVFEASTITEAALLSGTPESHRSDGATGGLLRVVGDFGILVLKDFTSVLSMNADTRKVLLAALREIHDGSWTRHLGTDGGKTFEWKGKVGVIAGVTPLIDDSHEVTSSMGERFLMVRIHTQDSMAQADRALRNLGREIEMRAELAQAVEVVMAARKHQPAPLSEEENNLLGRIAAVAARARSHVKRESHHSREIIHVPPAESPARLVKQLAGMLGGLDMIGVPRVRALEIIVRLALDSLPPARRAAVDVLATTDEGTKLADIVAATPYPATTLRRALEDLEAHEVVERSSAGRADSWALTAWVGEALHLGTGS